MLDARWLIEKHRSNGALIDTNLLVLLLVGLVNRRRIPQFKRTQNFTSQDFDALAALRNWFGKLVVTPHVMSQVSDLIDISGQDLARVRAFFRQFVEQAEEFYAPSRELVQDALFSRLGLTDAAIATVCSKGILLVTADLDLHLALQRRGADSLNFNHVRAMGWS
jgi:hypothetical protein